MRERMREKREKKERREQREKREAQFIYIEDKHTSERTRIGAEARKALTTRRRSYSFGFGVRCYVGTKKEHGITTF